MTLSAQPCNTERDFDCSIQTQPAGKSCQGSDDVSVGAILQAEQELDDTICELGLKSETAMTSGDPAGAREYSDRMYAAIASRTPEHQARLHAEVEQRIDDGLCFFGSDAAVAMGQLGKVGA